MVPVEPGQETKQRREEIRSYVKKTLFGKAQRKLGNNSCIAGGSTKKNRPEPRKETRGLKEAQQGEKREAATSSGKQK